MAPLPAKRARLDRDDVAGKAKDTSDVKDALIAALRCEVESLKDNECAYYASSGCIVHQLLHHQIPERGLPARHVKERILQQHELDNKPRLNTSSYVYVVEEPQEAEIALLGLATNLADASVYPASVRLHDTVANMLAHLWHCPAPGDENFSGSESTCGTGWLVFRRRKDLAEHIAVSVSYLGGKSDSMTLNFSLPATTTYVQFYKLLRLGLEGYTKKVNHQMAVAKYLRVHLKAAKFRNSSLFSIVDGGDEALLPVVGARLNPELNLCHNDIALQHALSEYHW
jgi:glutamate/tyrosine decarboxylase-like PLP-dependent enzyme